MGFDKLIDLFIEFIDLFRFWQVIREYERGIVLTLGKYRDRELHPGIHWIWPFAIDEVHIDNVVTRTDALASICVTVKDGSEIRVDGIVKWNIRDIRKALLDVEGLDDVFKDATYSTVSRILRARTWEEIHSTDIDEVLTKECRKRAFRFGVEIESVELGDLSRPIQIVTLQ